MKLTDRTLRQLLAALEEDVGSGDVTTQLTTPADIMARAEIVAKQDGIVCGVRVAEAVVTLAEPEVVVRHVATDGDVVQRGACISVWEGPARGLLAAERVALNLLGRLSGIATLTRRFVERVGRGTVCIRDTRKTTPLWRELEKYAVRTGGGSCHRSGLYDMILVKDNHIMLAGGIETALERAVAGRPPGMDIGVECATLDDVHAALRHPIEFVLLDNMDLETMRAAAALCRGKVRAEASGNVTLERVVEIAACGVTDISIGALTHSAPAFDFSMRMEKLYA